MPRFRMDPSRPSKGVEEKVFERSRSEVFRPVRDIGDPELVGTVDCEVAIEEIGRGLLDRSPDRRLALLPPRDADDAVHAQKARDAVAADRIVGALVRGSPSFRVPASRTRSRARRERLAKVLELDDVRMPNAPPAPKRAIAGRLDST